MCVYVLPAIRFRVICGTGDPEAWHFTITDSPEVVSTSDGNISHFGGAEKKCGH